MIYIAGKYTGKNSKEVLKNINLAEHYGQKVLSLGLVPFIPHVLGYSLSKNMQFTDWDSYDWLKKFCLPVLKRCDGIFLIPGWRESRGATIEHKFAVDSEIRVFKSFKELNQYAKAAKEADNFEEWLCSWEADTAFLNENLTTKGG